MFSIRIITQHKILVRSYNCSGQCQETHTSPGGPYPSVPGNFNGHDEQIERELPFVLITGRALMAVVLSFRIREHDHHGPGTRTVLWRRNAPGATCKYLISHRCPVRLLTLRLLIQYDLLSKWGGYLVNNTMDPDDRCVARTFPVSPSLIGTLLTPESRHCHSFIAARPRLQMQLAWLTKRMLW